MDVELELMTGRLRARFSRAEAALDVLKSMGLVTESEETEIAKRIKRGRSKYGLVKKKPKPPKSNTQHKWGEHFKENDSWYQKCEKCGLYRKFVCSKAYYSINAVWPGSFTTQRPTCQ